MSTTPRTDAAWSFAFTASEFSAASAARQMRDKCAELETELAAARSIVSRIWAQLGSPTYADLKGRSIYDLIDEIKTDRAEVEKWQSVAATMSAEREHNAHEAGRLRAEVERLTAYVSKAILTTEGTMLCSPQVAVKYNEANARAERAEAECLEQARLLGMSGEREADLLGKLGRAEKLKKFWKEFITLMEITEESESGNKFNPNKISSCRALDGRKLNEILVEARKIVF